jgi:methanogen extracellular protein (TIGR04279 family)
MTAPVSPNYYRYGAVIISQAAYSLVANLQTMGALSATDLFLNSVDVNVVATKTAQIFGAANIAIAFSNPTTSASGAVSVQTGADMPAGAYVLLMGVWESGGNKLVAFKQSTISLTTPTYSPPVAAVSGPAEAIEGDSSSHTYTTPGTYTVR